MSARSVDPAEPHAGSGPLLPCRCLLFVPGDRPERYPKALAAGADRVCVDLEDAVAPDRKGDARAAVAALVREGAWDHARSMVRVSHPGTREGRLDAGALVEAWSGAGPVRAPLTLMVPKCSSPADLEVVRDVFAGTPRTPASPGAGGPGAGRSPGRLPPALVPVVETAAGLAAVEEIACAPGVAALLLGGVDLTTELGAALEWDALLYARSRVVHAAALAGVPAVDVPFLDTDDDEGLLAEAERVRRLGFSGKAAIHPKQVVPVQRAFSPSEEEVARAEGVVRAAAGREGAFLHEGRMVDRPVVEAARRMLARAGRAP